MKLWRNGLIIAAPIYVVFVICGAVWTQLSLELIGLFGYAILAILGHRYSPYLLAAGWILHVLWDLLLHYPTSSIAPQWYPGMCLGFDLAVGGYVAYLIYSKGLNQKKEAQPN